MLMLGINNGRYTIKQYRIKYLVGLKRRNYKIYYLFIQHVEAVDLQVKFPMKLYKRNTP